MLRSIICFKLVIILTDNVILWLFSIQIRVNKLSNKLFSIQMSRFVFFRIWTSGLVRLIRYIFEAQI